MYIEYEPQSRRFYVKIDYQEGYVLMSGLDRLQVLLAAIKHKYEKAQSVV